MQRSRSSTVATLGMVVGLIALLVALSASGVLGPPAPRATDAGLASSNQQFERAIAASAGQSVSFSASDLGTILVRLTLAAILGLAVAFRGRRSEPGVVHTNMMIAFSGALAMMIVGSDLARAFGLVGASSIVRYRTPVRDPQALAALFVSMGAGIAVGVGLVELAIIATILVILIELALSGGGRRLSGGWFRPERAYELTVETDEAEGTLVEVRRIFNTERINHTLVDYEAAKKSGTVTLGLLVGLPVGADTEKLTLQILGAGARSVSWRLSKDA